MTHVFAYTFLARLAAHTRIPNVIGYYMDELPGERCELYFELYNAASLDTAYDLIVRIQNIVTQEEWESVSCVAASDGSK